MNLTPQGYKIFNLHFRSASVLQVGFTQFICPDKKLPHQPSPEHPVTGMWKRTFYGESKVRNSEAQRMMFEKPQEEAPVDTARRGAREKEMGRTFLEEQLWAPGLWGPWSHNSLRCPLSTSWAWAAVRGEGGSYDISVCVFTCTWGETSICFP